MKSLIIAPHPDDELLGCGGTLLKRVAEGNTVGWVLMTAISVDKGWTKQQVEKREDEIERVRKGLGINPRYLYRLNFPSAELDQITSSNLINRLSKVVQDFKPEELFLPHPGDIHSDHRVTFAVTSACTKWFRYPSIKRVMTYETLSETDFGLDQVAGVFRPNLFVDITSYLQRKMELLSVYQSEIGEHPFPRSLDSVAAQALLRGAQRGVKAAEAFQVLREFE